MKSYVAAVFGISLVAWCMPSDTQEPETAAIQRALDDTRATLVHVAAAVEELQSARPADPATKTASELGCRSNDKTFDNAPLLQAALDSMHNVELDETGWYYIGAPLRTKQGQSNVIRGQSAGYRHGAQGVTGLAALSEAVTHLIELPGTDDASGSGQVQVIRDLYLQGTPATDGIRIHGCRVATIEHCVIRNCKRGVLVEPTKGVYCPQMRGCSVLGCDVGIEIKNATTVCCFRADGCEVIGGRIGVQLTGWKRGAVFTGVCIEGQSERALSMTDAWATLIGSYIETNGTIPRAWLKDSSLTGMDTTCGNIAHNGASRVDWLGQNNTPYTLAYP